MANGVHYVGCVTLMYRCLRLVLVDLFLSAESKLLFFFVGHRVVETIELVLSSDFLYRCLFANRSLPMIGEILLTDFFTFLAQLKLLLILVVIIGIY